VSTGLAKVVPGPALSWRIRLAQWAAGFLTYKLLDEAFDYLLYPFVIYKLGPLCGGLTMTGLSFADCLLLLKLYDWLKRDWLGLETVKGLRHYTGTSRWRKTLAWLLHQGDTVAFVVLSVRFDPFITTAYMRLGNFTGMRRRDWRIFLGSGLLSNAVWTLVCYGGVNGVRDFF
jgi:hypothetical protein